MQSRQTAAVILTAAVFLGGHTWAHAQGTFGTPVAVDEGAKEPDEFGLTPPTRAQLFRVQSEQALKERLRKELPHVKKVDFPKDAPPPEMRGSLAPFIDQVVSPVAGRVCYRPLYFEDKRTERFGEYVPCLQPLLSAERFYRDFLMLPVQMCLTPPWTFECDNR